MDLDDALRAQNGTPRAASMRNQIANARGSERNAYAVCAGSDVKRAMQELKRSLRPLGRLRTLIAAKRAKTILNRVDLLATVDQLREDVRSLRSALSCPSDIGTP
jgi:hypothetical protein